jgi:hypothetical protein
MKVVNIQEIINKDELFHCGSPNLNKFLQKNGLDYISSYILNRNKKEIWLYLKSDKLSELLTIWSENKKVKGGEKVNE